MLTIDYIRTVINERDHQPVAFRGHASQAAVAMILADSEHSRGCDSELEVCFIRRAERPGDPGRGRWPFPVAGPGLRTLTPRRLPSGKPGRKSA